VSATSTPARDGSPPRVQRFPLFVGTRSYRTLATAPSWALFVAATILTLVVAAPMVHSRGFTLLAQSLGLVAFCLSVSPFILLAQLDWVIEHVQEALSSRACDLELGSGKVRIVGGPWHGFEATLDELSTPGAVKLTDVGLSLKPKSRRGVMLLMPKDPEERASLQALTTSLEAAALAETGANEPAPPSTKLAVLRCNGCGAPLAPTVASVMRCTFCGVETPTPPELARKLESAEVVNDRRRADEALCKSLRAQPGPRMANLIAFGGGALVLLLAAGSTLFAGMLGLVMDETDYIAKWRGIGPLACGVALSLIAFVRDRLSRRTALRILTLGFSARPPSRAGAPACCRNCGGALPVPSLDRVLFRCVYCDAENLTSIDLGFDAEVVRRFSAGELSPARELERVRARSLDTRLLAMMGVVMVLSGIVWRLY